LDKEVQEIWKLAKESLEGSFKYVHGKHVSLTDDTLFNGLLFCFEKGRSESFPVSFAFGFSEKEVGIMSKQKPSIN